jgi:tight adherence protein B
MPINYMNMLVIVSVVALVVGPILLALRVLWLKSAAKRAAQKVAKPELEGTGDAVRLAAPPADWAGKLDTQFEGMIKRTGLEITAAQALALICFAGVVAAGLIVVWREDLILIAVGMAVGMAIPLLIFQFLQGRWRKQLRDQLPDALFLLSRSLRAGLAFEQAMSTVGKHGVKPLADEFQRVAEQIKLGLSVPVAMQGMAERTDVEDIRIFASVVSLHRRHGGNLPQLLDRLAANTRDWNEYRGHFRSATALSRLTGITLALVPPLLFIGYLIWQPDYILKFIALPAGMMALSIAFMLEVVGVLWLWALLRKEG